MNKHLLQIDISKSENETEEDLIKIKFKNEEYLQINFTNFFFKSKYIQDKYKYCESINFIQDELDEIDNKLHISDGSLKYFFKLIEEEKVNIPIELYKDIYILSEYFRIPKITFVLNKIIQEELFNDLDFTIQILQETETSKNFFETKLTSKIENFLKERINECIVNSKFGELPVPTIYRILEESKGKIDDNLLIDFIFESVESRFVIFKLIEVDKLREDKIYEMIKLIEEQEEDSRKIYLEYIPFNLALIKNMKCKYDQLLNEMNETKQELKQTNIKYKQTKQELEQTNTKYKQTKQELEQTNTEYEQTKQDLKQSNTNYEQTKQDLEKTNINYEQTKQVLKQTNTKYLFVKQELEKTKQELDKCKREMRQAKDEINQSKIENERFTQSILVCGWNGNNGLGEISNNKVNSGSIIHPPVKLSLDPSSIRSYSVYYDHAVLVMKDGSLKGVGYNIDGQISSTLQDTIISNFTNFCIKDESNRQLAAVSAVCYNYGTLYMFSKSSGSGRQLVLCDSSISEGYPVFLDIGDHYPVSLFGGYSHSAAICEEGEIIFINRNSVIKSPNSPIEAVSLPNGQKASSVACCDDIIVVLSSNGRVFTSRIESNGVLKFSIVSELSSQEIVCVSGTCDHCLAVSKEGRVFGRGSNEFGQLGLGERAKSASTFTEIFSRRRYKMRAAYAGFLFSLFETREGKILSCGRNFRGELLLSKVPVREERVYSLTETTITQGAGFCIAGCVVSAVFIGNGPPPNTPNMRILQYQ